MERVVSKNDFQKQLVKVENEIHAIEQKRNRLVDIRLEITIDKATYEKKYMDQNPGGSYMYHVETICLLIKTW